MNTRKRRQNQLGFGSFIVALVCLMVIAFMASYGG